jgi:hypothetical protein
MIDRSQLKLNGIKAIHVRTVVNRSYTCILLTDTIKMGWFCNAIDDKRFCFMMPSQKYL